MSTNNLTYINEDARRSAWLAAQLADVEFLCEVCQRRHPLAEHAGCRAPQPGRIRL